MRAFLIFCFLLAGALPVAGATYPERPIRMIVPVPPGGSSDFTARIVGQKLVEAFGQNVVIENRSGASGVIASEMVARANADGYTLLMSSSSTHGIGPVLYRKLPYDAIRSFTHVALINTIPTAMVVHQSVPANSIREFVALAKARPDAYSFGSSGGGSASRLMGELFKLETGAPLTHVPYKGSGLATLDLIAGQVQVMFDGLPSHIANIKSGKLRAIAVLGERRSAALPNVPTAAEMGYPRIEGSLWYGVSGPAGLPREIVEKLRKEIFRIDALDEIRERFAGAGAFPSPLGPREYTKFIEAENAKWAPVVAASGATAE